MTHRLAARADYEHFAACEGYEGDVISRLSVQWMLSKLDPKERDILVLWKVENLTFQEIGAIIGLKYGTKPLTGSAIRYHKERIVKILAQYRDELAD